jgi:endonuclease G
MLTLSRLAALFGIAISMGSATTASAGTQCPQHFYGGREPTLMNQRLTAKARELCYTSFVSYHSGLTRTPLYSAEHLVREHIQEARDMEREDSFHPDPNLPYDERSELADFRGSGWDRGHLSPNGDMPDTKSQGESFTLGNMIPQAPDNNR